MRDASCPGHILMIYLLFKMCKLGHDRSSNKNTPSDTAPVCSRKEDIGKGKGTVKAVWVFIC